jgi:hypothetical protein
VVSLERLASLALTARCRHQVLHAHWAALQLWVNATLHLAEATEPLRRALRASGRSAERLQGQLIQECVSQLAALEVSAHTGAASSSGTDSGTAACASDTGKGLVYTERSGSLSSKTNGGVGGSPGRTSLDRSGGSSCGSISIGAAAQPPPGWAHALLAADVDDLIQRHKEPLAFAKFLGRNAKDMAVDLLRCGWLVGWLVGWVGGWVCGQADRQTDRQAGRQACRCWLCWVGSLACTAQRC